MCGFSPAPAPPGGGSAPGVGRVPLPQLDWGWTSFGSWLDRLRQAGLTGNVVPFVGHGTLRIAAMGFEQRPPTADEARHMAALLGAALDAGAFGLSTGLIYAPSVYADTAELIALARVAGSRAGRLYASHIRGEGPTLEAALAEAIRIGDEGGRVRPDLASQGLPQGELAQDGRAPSGRSRRPGPRGVDVTADMYPYTAGSTDPRELAARVGPRGRHGGPPRAGWRTGRRAAGSSTRAGPPRASGTGRTAPVALAGRDGRRVPAGPWRSRAGRWPRSPPTGGSRPRTS